MLDLKGSVHKPCRNAENTSRHMPWLCPCETREIPGKCRDTTVKCAAPPWLHLQAAPGKPGVNTAPQPRPGSSLSREPSSFLECASPSSIGLCLCLCLAQAEILSIMNARTPVGPEVSSSLLCKPLGPFFRDISYPRTLLHCLKKCLQTRYKGILFTTYGQNLKVNLICTFWQ